MPQKEPNCNTAIPPDASNRVRGLRICLNGLRGFAGFGARGWVGHSYHRYYTGEGRGRDRNDGRGQRCRIAHEELGLRISLNVGRCTLWDQVWGTLRRHRMPTADRYRCILSMLYLRRKPMIYFRIHQSLVPTPPMF